jgi:hypothetical protein
MAGLVKFTTRHLFEMNLERQLAAIDTSDVSP